jgi:hypothetical protein
MSVTRTNARHACLDSIALADVNGNAVCLVDV